MQAPSEVTNQAQESTTDLLAAVGDLLPESRVSVSFSAGTTIFTEGELGDCAYLVESGSLRMSRTLNGRDRTLAMIGPGNLVGEVALLGNGERIDTVVAATDAELLVVTRDQVDRELRSCPPLARLLLRVLLERLDLMTRIEQADDEATIASEAADPSFDGQDTTQVKVVHAVRLERQLREALSLGEFEVYYQPVVSIKGRKLVGFEALVRWNRPEVGVVAPVEFIWLAEQSGIIVPLGAFVLAEAADFANDMRKRLDAAGLSIAAPFVSVNVSPRQLENEASVTRLLDVLSTAGVTDQAIKLEITESVLLENPEASAEALKRIKATGVTLAVDDFGTGYASLSYMPRYPLDTLKIDRSFVQEIEDPGNLEVIRSMVVLARGLGMDIVAEGVETTSQLEKLAELDCDNGQGYLFARPMQRRKAMRMVKRAVSGRMQRPTDVTRVIAARP